MICLLIVKRDRGLFFQGYTSTNKLQTGIICNPERRHIVVRSNLEIATRITIAWLSAFAVITKELGHTDQHIPTKEEVSEFLLEIYNTACKTTE